MRPMLATKIALDAVRYPVLASPKLDGIRCIMVGGRALTRNLKPVPNKHVRAWLEAHCPDGLDGELMLPSGNFQEISSCFMSRDEVPPEFWYLAAFDLVDLSEASGVEIAGARNRCEVLRHPAAARQVRLSIWHEFSGASGCWDHVRLVPQMTVRDREQLEALETECLSLGFEGVMLRAVDSPYKFGRSTAREGWLCKLKRFEDSEAVVTGTVELQRNENTAEESELGLTKRGKSKAGMRAGATLGALQVTDCVTGISFEIGTGFTAAQRRGLWLERDFLVGRLCKYKHFAVSGVKEKPRFPVFLGWRDRGDMDPTEGEE